MTSYTTVAHSACVKNDKIILIKRSKAVVSVVLAGEIEQLRSAVQQLMVANVEKEEEIEKLKICVAKAANFGEGINPVR